MMHTSLCNLSLYLCIGMLCAMIVNCASPPVNPCDLKKCDAGYKCIPEGDGKCVADCKSHEKLCDDKCVDTQVSNAHCGACGVKCDDGKICKKGKCLQDCETGQSLCGESCVDLQKDDKNCGTCGLICRSELYEVCVAGKCQVRCPSDKSECAGSCVDLQSSTEHCGACQTACKKDEICNSGKCELHCAGGTVECAGECVNLQRDPAHCGSCRNACPSGQKCVAGKCLADCPSAQTECEIDGQVVCTNTQTDPKHCGACGHVCASGQVCIEGKCAASCPVGQSECLVEGKSRCVDLQSDSTHCGACNQACPSNEVCNAGVCKTNCPGGQEVCKVNGVAQCIDTQSNINHCGKCDASCTGGKLCISGVCTCPSELTDCAGVCVDTATDRNHCGACNTQCASGQLCASGKCAVSCPTGQSECLGACIDTKSDRNHCGACGTKCDNRKECINGTCRCPSELTDCAGVCVDTATDRNHCGACNTQCASGQLCASGKCAVSCPTGQSECLGACVDTKSDPNNCGKCDIKCTGGKLCTNGSCACPSGLTDCSGLCRDLKSDVQNCGACARSCATNQFCHNGICAILCQSGKTNCAGTCTDLQTDPQNCGTCGHICKSSESCSAGKCEQVAWVRHARSTSMSMGTGYSIAVDSVNNTYITGYFQDTTVFGTTTLAVIGGFRDVFVAKLDANGNFLWAKSAGGTDENAGYGIAVDSSGNSYITGEFFTKAVFGTITLTSAGGQNMFVAKLDANGNFLWAKNAGGTSISVGTSVAVHNSKNIYITGFFIGTVIFGTTTLTSAVGQNVFVAKLDANGNFLWAKSAGGTSGNISRGITVDSGDNTYITGFFFGTAIFGTTTLISAGYDDVFVAKLDANGNFLWATRAGGTKPDQSLSVAVDNSGNSYITGSFQSEAVFSTTTLISAGDAEVFVAKLDSNGNFLWAIRAGGMISKIGSSIAVDNGGNNYITGYFKYNAVFGTTTLKSAGDVDVFVAKLNTNGNFLWARRAGGTYQDRGHGATVDSVGNHYITGHFYSPAVFGTTTLTSGGGITVFVSKNLP